MDGTIGHSLELFRAMAFYQASVIFLLLLGSAGSLHAEEARPQSLPRKTFHVCGRKLVLEIARDFDSRQIGLMHREGIKPGTGMLFVFAEAAEQAFWMRNVGFSIDIGYFDAKGLLKTALTMEGTSPLTRDDALPRYPS